MPEAMTRIVIEHTNESGETRRHEWVGEGEDAIDTFQVANAIAEAPTVLNLKGDGRAYILAVHEAWKFLEAAAQYARPTIYEIQRHRATKAGQ